MDENENNASTRGSTAEKRNNEWPNAKKRKRDESPSSMARPSFLEQLRNGLLVQFNGKLTKEFLIEHQAEFPAKIKAAIANAANLNSEQEFTNEICRAVRQLFMGREVYNPLGTELYAFDKSNQNWYGLDSSIDTENEVEAVIHCFPCVLHERFQGRLQGRLEERLGGQHCIPIEMLLSRKEALSFIPLFIKMMRYCPYSVLEKLFFPQRSTFHILFGEAFVSESRVFDDHAVMQEYSNEALSILSRLIAQERITKMQTLRLVQGVFTTDFQFVVVEPIFRKLINWNPSVLYGFTDSLLRLYPLDKFYATFFDNNGTYIKHGRNESHIQMFETILDLCMTQFPQQLGFVFHKRLSNKQTSNFAFPTIFHMLMKWGSVMGWSSEKPLKIIHDNVFNNEVNLKTLPSLVVYLAYNDRICLDGLYELIRFNPIECLRH